MSYLSQIAITEAREWLRLDDNSNDAIITLMMANACRTFEDRTNHLIYQRSKDYKARQRIYDFPIADTTGLEEKNYYYLSDEDVTLDVGYTAGNLPDEIKAVVLTMVEAQFYANENEGATNYPPIVKETINVFKRFFI